MTAARPALLAPLALAALVALVAAPLDAQSRTASRTASWTAGPRVVGYLASWGVRAKKTRIASLPAARLTHVFYAFGAIASDGRVVLGDRCLDVGACGKDTALPARPRGNFGELRRLKDRHPHLRLAISLGGWGGSARFSDAALTDSSRRLFVTSAVDLYIRRWPGLFDGIDVDWEFPVRGGMKGNVERPGDRANFTLLLAELRRELDEQGRRDGRRYELTIAASARPSEIANLEVDRIAPLLDFVNIMTYDYHVASRVAHFNAPLFPAAGDPTPELTIDASVRVLREAGVPAEKLLVGVPFYGRLYRNVPGTDAGRFQPVDTLPFPSGAEAGDWRTLSRGRLRDRRFAIHWDSLARVPWAYDATSRVWITYDDERSVREKARYVRQHGLGGVIIWELGGDDGRLMRALSRGLAGR